MTVQREKLLQYRAEIITMIEECHPLDVELINSLKQDLVQANYMCKEAGIDINPILVNHNTNVNNWQ